MAPTDSEDRHVASERLAGERELEIVPAPVDLAELRVRGLAVERGVDVDATREQEAVEPVEERRGVLGPDRGQHDRDGARLLDGPHVVLAHGVEPRPRRRPRA